MNDIYLEAEKEAPQPLRKEGIKAIDFPVNELPPLLKNAVLGVHDKIQSSIPICAQSVLSVANLAVQGYANMKALEEIKPISCYFITIAETGERKTASDDEALKSIIKYQTYLRKEYREKIQEYKSKSRIWEQKEREIIRSKSPISIDERLARLGRLIM